MLMTVLMPGSQQRAHAAHVCVFVCVCVCLCVVFVMLLACQCVCKNYYTNNVLTQMIIETHTQQMSRLLSRSTEQVLCVCEAHFQVNMS